MTSPSHPPRAGNRSSNSKVSRGPLQHRCGLCLKRKSELSRCTGCRAVRYCSLDHQVQHRQEHQSLCNKIKRHRSKVDKEEHALRNAKPNVSMPANVFETQVGHFWGILGTRDYMRARCDLADTLRESGTLDGVIEALGHLRDMVRLCRGDNMGLRDLIAPLMLQLDQDQECYDFIKWWDTTALDEHYDWSNKDLPFLNIQGANVFNVDYMHESHGNFQLLGAALLLKMKLLVDMINIKRVRKVCATDGRLPPELWRHVERHVVRSPLSRQWAGKPDQELMEVLRKLESNVELLGRSLHTMNRLFASGLLDPDQYLVSLPAYYHYSDSFEEMQIFLDCSYAAWWQHEGILELLWSAKFITAKEALLEDLSDDIDNPWVYFGQAVDDAMSLSEIPPSETRRLETKK